MKPLLSRRTKSSRGRGSIEYGWFEFRTDENLATPPDFTSSSKPVAGDIFVHYNGAGNVPEKGVDGMNFNDIPGKRRYWIWMPQAQGGWEPITVGKTGHPVRRHILCAREDGSPCWLLPKTIEKYKQQKTLNVILEPDPY
jgi:hypothetical protein